MLYNKFSTHKGRSEYFFKVFIQNFKYQGRLEFDVCGIHQQAGVCF